MRVYILEKGGLSTVKMDDGLRAQIIFLTCLESLEVDSDCVNIDEGKIIGTLFYKVERLCKQ